MMWVVAVVLSMVCLGLALALRRAQQETSHLKSRLKETHRGEHHEVEELRDQLQLHRGVFEIIEDALMVVDSTQQRILLANPAAHRLFGKTMVGETLIAATRNFDLDRLIQEGQAAPDKRADQILEIDHRQMRARIAAIGSHDQTFYGISLHDETEVMRLARARREMVANISHELRHPIGVVSLMIDTLISGTLDKKKDRKKMLKDMRREIDELTHLVNEMRDLSLIESGQMPLKLMPTHLLDVVQSSVASLQTLADGKSQTITVNIPEEMTVLMDAAQIQRVCKNILHNAIKFAPENGNILIKATLNSEDVTIAIQNDGPPIPSEDLPRLFERFFQVDRSRTDGTGLGLAIARHIIRAHAGRLWAVNKPDNEGVIFYFTLARADVDLSGELPSDAASSPNINTI